jgi:hypothetical protein
MVLVFAVHSASPPPPLVSQDKKGNWYMEQKGAEVEKRYAGKASANDLRSNIALCGVQAYLKVSGIPSQRPSRQPPFDGAPCSGSPLVLMPVPSQPHSLKVSSV